jgi:type IV pilus assembly protein PilW
MQTFNRNRWYRQTSHRKGMRGFSVIELMIGLVLGLLAIMAIFQIMTTWDARRRTITDGNSAQISGEIGILELERDLNQSGVGFGNATSTTLGCSVAVHNSGLATTDFTVRFAPVEIINGASGAPDTVNVFYGSSAFSNNIQKVESSTNTTKVLQYRAGFNLGDLVVVAGNSPVACTMFEVTDNTVADAKTISHGTANYTSFYTAAAVTPSMNVATPATAYTTAEIYNLGPSAQRTQWAISAAGVLTRINSLKDTAVAEVSEGVVDLQAQYGVDGSDGSAFNGKIEDAEWTNTAPTAGNWNRLLAVRVAVLARSGQLEKDIVTVNAPTWGGNTIAFVMRNLDGSTGATAAIANDWHHYRFRVYESMVPMRNMMWGSTS